VLPLLVAAEEMELKHLEAVLQVLLPTFTWRTKHRFLSSIIRPRRLDVEMHSLEDAALHVQRPLTLPGVLFEVPVEPLPPEVVSINEAQVADGENGTGSVLLRLIYGIGSHKPLEQSHAGVICGYLTRLVHD